MEHNSSVFSTAFGYILKDPRLSLKAKGILAQFVCNPETTFSDLIENSTDRQFSVRQGIKELLTTGYVARDQNRNHNGKFDSVRYIVNTFNINNKE
jgi:hypothetical protein